ncbi:unnamed protein product [Amoebophrya sp. A25]|nr:unnamed protein product [Amoebophrya sp. A25]|eukprot:GSA25T00005373001.1
MLVIAVAVVLVAHKGSPCRCLEEIAQDTAGAGRGVLLVKVWRGAQEAGWFSIPAGLGDTRATVTRSLCLKLVSYLASPGPSNEKQAGRQVDDLQQSPSASAPA